MPLPGEPIRAEIVPDAPYVPPLYATIVSGGWFGVGTVGWQDIGTFIDFSLGTGTNWWGDQNWEEPSLPPLDAETILETTATLPPAIDRRDIPPIPEHLPMPVTPDWALCAQGDQAACDRMANAPQIIAGQVFNPVDIPPPPPPVFAPVPTAPETAEFIPPIPLETGGPPVSWIGDVYDIIDTGAGGILPGGVPFTGLPYPTNPASIPTTTALPPQVINPGVVAAPQSNCGGSWVYKKHCGQYRWVKQTRRRRKQIVSRSDLRGLAALKGVLGTGKAFEVWIATHA